MKKALLLIGAALASLSLSFAQALQETLQKSDNASLREVVNMPEGFTYANPGNASEGKVSGAGTGTAGKYASAAIELPPAEGLIIKGISYYCNSDEKSGKIFIASRHTSGTLGKYTLDQLTDIETSKGLITANFKTPITCEANKVYVIGYEVKQTEIARRPIGFVDDSNCVPSSNLLAIRDASMTDKETIIELEEISIRKLGNLAIVLHYDDPKGKYGKLGFLERPSFPLIKKVGNVILAPETKAFLSIRNLGTETITRVSFIHKKTGSSAENKEYAVNIAPSKSGTIEYEGNEITALGRGAIEMTLNKVNGDDNGIKESASTLATIPYYLFPEDMLILRKKNLLERFTTEKCSACPYAEPKLDEAYKMAKKRGLHVAVAAHHVGYKTDFLTLKESEELLPFFTYPSGGAFAPAFAISRISDAGIRAQIPKDEKVGMYLGIINTEIALKQLLLAHDIPTEGRICQITQKDTGEDRRSITVEGKFILPETIKDDVYLSIYRTEDDVTAQNQANGNSSFLHQSVIRKFITPTFGEKVTVAENGEFTIKVENVEIKSNWDNEKMHFVIFIHRDIRNKDHWMRYVYATEKIGVHSMTGTREVAPEIQPVAYALDGRILINGAFDSFTVYDISGRLVAGDSDTKLSQGFYIVKTTLGDVDYISKVLVK